MVALPPLVWEAVGIALGPGAAAANWLLDLNTKEPVMTTNLHTLEKNMITSTFDEDEVVAPPVTRHRTASALRRLVRDWERNGAVDENESETELMVLLSGMVSVSDPAARDL